ncbi:MAG: RNase adapter RapZ [Eubacteriales bacterium]
MDILIVTGMSGAGKKTVQNHLEDLGYFCVDNMPVTLIERFFEIYEKNPEKNQRVSFTLDVRTGDDPERLLDVIREIRKKSPVHTCRILYLDAADDVIIKRYKETRHVHPLVRTREITLERALVIEREMLSGIKDHADFLIDTSDLRPADLKKQLTDLLLKQDSEDFLVSIISFGYKYGCPHDLDLMFDVRCFPNPFYIPELKSHTGLEECVNNYVFSFSETGIFLEKLNDLIDYLIPLYRKEGKSMLTIGIGCTGGKHRSVSIAQALSDHFRTALHINPVVLHRDITK